MPSAGYAYASNPKAAIISLTSSISPGVNAELANKVTCCEHFKNKKIREWEAGIPNSLCNKKPT